jgi:hypothetical protein
MSGLIDHLFLNNSMLGPYPVHRLWPIYTNPTLICRSASKVKRSIHIKLKLPNNLQLIMVKCKPSIGMVCGKFSEEKLNRGARLTWSIWVFCLWPKSQIMKNWNGDIPEFFKWKVKGITILITCWNLEQWVSDKTTDNREIHHRRTNLKFAPDAWILCNTFSTVWRKLFCSEPLIWSVSGSVCCASFT